MFALTKLFKKTLCKLGFHMPDQVCKIKQHYYRAEDGVLEYTRTAEECRWCRKQFIFWDWHHVG